MKSIRIATAVLITTLAMLGISTADAQNLKQAAKPLPTGSIIDINGGSSATVRINRILTLTVNGKGFCTSLVFDEGKGAAPRNIPQTTNFPVTLTVTYTTPGTYVARLSPSNAGCDGHAEIKIDAQ